MFNPTDTIPKDTDIFCATPAKVQSKIFSFPPEGLPALTTDRRLIFVPREKIPPL